MKQRLSIAIALLHHPSLLILDEPTNGLDPNGMIEVRELLRELNKENGIAIIVSSHLLSEIEKLVTHLGIISKGQLLFQGTLDELKSKRKNAISIVFKTNDDTRAVQLISENNPITVGENGEIILSEVSKQRVAKINQQLVNGGIEVFEIKAVSNDLESIFMDVINVKP